MLVGQDLISAAATRAQITQIQKYDAAVNTFKNKYGYIPGDIPDPYASQFGFQARGQYAGQGDGNGLIEGVWANAPSSSWGECQNMGETVVFWTDLSTAKLIDANLTIGSPISEPSNNPAALYPAAKIGNNNYVYAWSDIIASVRGLAPISDNTNFFGLSANIVPGGGQMSSNPGLTIAQAFNIDKKSMTGCHSRAVLLQCI